MTSTEAPVEIAEIQNKLYESKEKFTKEFQEVQKNFTAQINELKNEIQQLNTIHKKNVSEAVEWSAAAVAVDTVKCYCCYCCRCCFSGLCQYGLYIQW